MVQSLPMVQGSGRRWCSRCRWQLPVAAVADGQSPIDCSRLLVQSFADGHGRWC